MNLGLATLVEWLKLRKESNQQTRRVGTREGKPMKRRRYLCQTGNTTQNYSRGDQHWRPTKGKFYVWTRRGKAVRESEATNEMEASNLFIDHMERTYGRPNVSWEHMGFTIAKA